MNWKNGWLVGTSAKVAVGGAGETSRVQLRLALRMRIPFPRGGAPPSANLTRSE